MPTLRDRNVRKLRRMRKKARARMKDTLKELSTSKEPAKPLCVLNCMVKLFLEVEEKACSVAAEDDTSSEVKDSSKKKRLRRDLNSMPQRTKRQKCSEEGVNSSSDFESVDEELESTDDIDETGDTKETSDSHDNTEGTCIEFAICSHWQNFLPALIPCQFFSIL